MPLGVGINYLLQHGVDLGAEFKFTDLVGNGSGADGRRRKVVRNSLPTPGSPMAACGGIGAGRDPGSVGERADPSEIAQQLLDGHGSMLSYELDGLLGQQGTLLGGHELAREGDDRH